MAKTKTIKTPEELQVLADKKKANAIANAKKWAGTKLKNDEDATAFTQARGLPPLEGSEKQIHWATAIRYNWLSYIASGAGQEDVLALMGDNAATYYNWLTTKTQSVWWIENRYDAHGRVPGSNWNDYLQVQLVNNGAFEMQMLFEIDEYEKGQMYEHFKGWQT